MQSKRCSSQKKRQASSASAQVPPRFPTPSPTRIYCEYAVRAPLINTSPRRRYRRAHTTLVGQTSSYSDSVVKQEFAGIRCQYFSYIQLEFVLSRSRGYTRFVASVPGSASDALLSERKIPSAGR